MKVAIMQPYFMPYIGYFQLIAAVDVFVFYDDVNFIKGGWINRNRILTKNGVELFTLACKGISPNRCIKEIELNAPEKSLQLFLKKIELAYKRAPFFHEVSAQVLNRLSPASATISLLAQDAIQLVCAYLGMDKIFLSSSSRFADTKVLEREERLIQICTELQATDYINPIGGSALYSKPHFEARGIHLHFLQSTAPPYPQYRQAEFISHLSIIDVLMHNPKEQIRDMLQQYRLE